MMHETPSVAEVRSVLAEFQDPETGRSIVQLEQIHNLHLADGKLSLTLGLTTWAAPMWEQTRTELAALLKQRFPSLEVCITLVEHHRPAEKLSEIGLAAKTVLAVGSGKGGVGKSSFAVYLAYGLHRAGCKVGLMDADFYGPSIPYLLGCRERPHLIDGRIQPATIDGLQLMSVGLLAPDSEAVIWRGPMLHNALRQLLKDTAWAEMDYLIVDLPPGTGDVAISLSQLMPTSAAVVVCTPQDVALLDAVKAIAMFRRIGLEVVGMVENMSYFICPHCQSRHDIFGHGGAKRRAEELALPFLGAVPLLPELRTSGDAGQAGKAFNIPSAAAALEEICRNVSAELIRRRKRQPVMPTLPIIGG